MTRQQWIDAGICPSCFKEKLVGDERTCVMCRMRQSISQDKRYARKREEILIYYKTKRDERKAQGLCTICGKEKTGEYTMCEKCREKRNKYKRSYYKKQKEIMI